MKITGDLIIKKDGRFFLEDRELEDDDTITISIIQLKHIIRDAKKGLI